MPATEFDDQKPEGLPEEDLGQRPAGVVAHWVAGNPETRGPVLAGLGDWSAAAVEHAIGASWYYPVAGTALVATIAAATAAARAKRQLKVARALGGDSAPGFTPAEVAAAATAAGAWMTAAAQWGPVPAYSPSGWWLTLAIAAGTWYGTRHLKRHPVIRARRAAIAEAERWEARKAWWHSYCGDVGLDYTHLIDYIDTLLGVDLCIDTTSTTLRASQFNTANIAELIAEREALPVGRVDVWVNQHERAGRLRIRIRREDPWKHPFPHPVLGGADAPFAALIAGPATCTRPLVIGVDPDTGRALRLPVWEPGQGGKVIMVLASKGSGKALALDTPLPTPAGWTTMGEVRAGDWLLGQDGMPTRVTAATEIMRDHPCYEVEFSDGTVIVADAEHLWETWSPYAREADGGCRSHAASHPATVTTEQIAKTLRTRHGRLAHAVRLCAALQLPARPLRVDPYTLGIWLSDGVAKDGVVAIADGEEEIAGRIAQVNPVRRWNPSRIEYGIGGLKSGLADLGLLGNKHIPQEYLRASVEQRLALLQGLMDADGHVTRRGHCSFVNTNEQLVDDFCALVTSLGGLARKCSAWTRPGRKPCYRVGVSGIATPFSLARKAKRVAESTVRPPRYRHITEVRPVRSRPVRCIQVDNADALYLAGPTCIPTHNTVLMNCVTEALTRCRDAIVIQVNLVKVREEQQWAPACALSDLGAEQLAHARRALQWVVDYIESRSRGGAEAIITPSAAEPLIVVKLDEYPAVKNDPVCRQLVETIAQACRSEAVSLLIGAQTRRAEMVGAKLRALTDVLLLGRFKSDAEARRAADGAAVPDLSLYGANQAGVWAVIDPGVGFDLGRTFKLEQPREIAAIVRDRARRGAVMPVHHSPRQAWLWAQADGSVALEPIWDDESYLDDGGGAGLARRALAEAAELQARAAAGPPDEAARDVSGGGDGGFGGGRPAELRARIGGIIEHASETDPGLSGVPDEVRERMRQMSAARHQQVLAEFTAEDIPPQQAVALLALLCEPDGLSSRDAARILLGGEKGRMTAFRWLTKFKDKGLAEVRGKGSRQRFYATEKGRQEYARAAGGDAK